MRVIFRQCRICPKDNSCEYRDSVREELGDILTGLTSLINCPEYRQLFKAGDRVRFEVHDMDDTEDAGIEGGYRVNCVPYYESTGEMVAGTITGKIHRGKLYQIKLDKKLKLNRLDEGGKLHEVEMEFYVKPANKMKLLKKGEL